MDLLESLGVISWEGMSRSLEKSETDSQCTSRLTQGRYQESTTTCCTSENIPPSLSFPRSGDEWLVGMEGSSAELKASVGVEPNQPPSTGWKFFNVDTWVYEVDATISCSIYVNSPPCCLTVTPSGAAKETHGKCEGEYKSTGLMSRGRPVIFI